MKDKKLIATMGLFNTGGIAILDIIYDIEDKLKFAYHDGEKFGRVCTSIISNDTEGNAYFISGNQKYYLSEFIKSEDE